MNEGFYYIIGDGGCVCVCRASIILYICLVDRQIVYFIFIIFTDCITMSDDVYYLIDRGAYSQQLNAQRILIIFLHAPVTQRNIRPSDGPPTRA